MAIQMPGVNGYELMKYTRQLRPALPVIIISGLSYSKNFEELSKYKNVKFIEKPFNPLILLEMIERLIASKEPD
jgi:DNA-binding NtrC family response regulator